MMTEEKIKKKLKNYTTGRRYQHTLGVAEVARKLAIHYHVSVDRAIVAALLHDCAKELTDQELLNVAEDHQIKIDRFIRREPQILHGQVGAIIAKRDFGIDDELILDAIRYHTMGRKKMTQLDKIIYLADCIEPNRSYPKVKKIRKLAFIDLDQAVLETLDESLMYLIKKGRLINKSTFSARNDIIYNLKNKK